MGFLGRLFGKRPAAEPDGEGVNLAFVLLSEPRMPGAQDIIDAFAGFAAPGETLRVDEADDGKHDEILMLELGTGGNVFVALMPVAVPKGEADEAARYSLSSFRDDWKLPAHCAHLVVTTTQDAVGTPVERLSRFTSLVAAVTKCSPAVGVYWGNAGATHDAAFFTEVAADQGIVPRIMLWSGVSMAREGDGRLSLLSMGMDQLNLPDLLLVAGPQSAPDAVETLYDLLAYVAERGEALPEGDTVGRTAEQRLPVRYVRSPVDKKKQVWRVDLP